jgi:hypothetical protein
MLYIIMSLSFRGGGLSQRVHGRMVQRIAKYNMTLVIAEKLTPSYLILDSRGFLVHAPSHSLNRTVNTGSWLRFYWNNILASSRYQAFNCKVQSNISFLVKICLLGFSYVSRRVLICKFSLSGKMKHKAEPRLHVSVSCSCSCSCLSSTVGHE